MAIDVLSDRSYNGVKESVATAKTVATKTNAKASANISTADKTYVAAQDAVVLTDSAKTLAKAKQIAKDSSGIDSAKVEKLKKAINDGSYKINYESVANKLIDSEDEISSIFG
ncbi:MAG: flagellar biosynthesis anti-sigma factor FlgM [Succinatimonas sp.]|jgi:negative regulator of flagellin synthesis FlgM|nr:flagellar biosynthesis anti-sigma factor FlgM [Succinatimonas sp.]MDY5722261.1 flagellar biosynthesis anti-sigma factor FlgM [Succinivibrio sp.]